MWLSTSFLLCFSLDLLIPEPIMWKLTASVCNLFWSLGFFLKYIWILVTTATSLYLFYNVDSNFFCSRGEPKCWYSVPGSQARAFEKVGLGLLFYMYTNTSSSFFPYPKTCNFHLNFVCFFQPQTCRIKGLCSNHPNLFYIEPRLVSFCTDIYIHSVAVGAHDAFA